MIKIIPAILPSSLQELTQTLERFRGVVSTIQIDVVDGIFAPHKTWPYTKGGRKEFEKIAAEQHGMPFWKEFDFELDLMVKDSKEEITKWFQAGASRLIVHAKSKNAKEALESMQNARGEGRTFISLGVALPSHGTLADLSEFAGLYDFVQVMGIDHEGFQGEPPDPHDRASFLIKELRAAHPELSISVDGGVRMENIAALVRAGADRLVVGSLLLKSDDLRATLREVIDTANHQTA